jgi:hypothetical protein
VNVKELSPAVRKAVDPLKPGEVSEPVPGPDGFRIFKLESRTEEAVVPFEEVKENLRKGLAGKRGNALYDKYLEDLRKDAIVELKVREVPLQVSRPVAPTTFLDPPLPGDLEEPAPPREAEKVAPAGDVPELVTSPQAAPERVAPPPLPDEKKTEDGTAPH